MAIYKSIPEPVDVPSADLVAQLGLPARGTSFPRLIIGRREWLALPDLGIMPLNSKIDSGARSSSLHAENIILSHDAKHVRFTTRNHHRQSITCEVPVAKFGRVRNSTGHATQRIFIETTAVLTGGFRWPILVSLSDRKDMRCPILLGRRALAGYFMIDPLGNHLLGTRRQLETHFQVS